MTFEGESVLIKPVQCSETAQTPLRGPRFRWLLEELLSSGSRTAETPGNVTQHVEIEVPETNNSSPPQVAYGYRGWGGGIVTCE